MIDDSERLPTRDEIAADDDLDGIRAIRDFCGKTLAEAEELFASGIPLSYTEDLVWMKPIGFRFYVRAAIRYGLSERATGDSDFVDGLAGTLSSWLEAKPDELAPCAHLLAETCVAVSEQFDRYDADPDIYVGLREQYQHLAERFARMAGDGSHT